MKRFFAVLGGVAFITSLLNLFTNSVFAVVFLLTAIVVFIIKDIDKEQKLLAIALILVLIFGVINSSYQILTAKEVVGQQQIRAKVIDISESKGYNRVTVKTRVGFTILKAELFDFSKENYTKGDTITAIAELETPQEDEALRLYPKGVHLCGKATLITEIQKGKGIYKLGYHLTEYIEGLVRKQMDNNSASPLIAILTGEQEYFDSPTKEAIKASGVSHIMVVSGLHLGIICGAVVGLLKKIKADSKTVFFGGTVSIFLILLICSFHISAIRAAITYLLILIGLLIRRQADALNSLGFSVFVIVTAGPFIAGNISFLLSVSATFGVIVIAPKLKNICTPAHSFIKSSLLTDGILNGIYVSISALICTLPVLVLNFGQISVASIFVNLLITYAVSIALILTVIGVIIGFIPAVAAVIFQAAGLIGRYVMWVISAFGGNEQFVFYFEGIGAIIIAIIDVLLIAGIIYIDIKKQERRIRNADK